MASNADLIAVANALGQKLDEQVETKGLKNAELVKLVSELRARADAAAKATATENETVSLVAQANALAGELGTTVETDGLTDDALRDLIDSMKVGVDEAAKEAADAEAADAAAEGAKENEAAKPVEVEEEKPPYYIMAGKSMTTIKRGIVGPLEEIRPDDIKGGKDALEAFVKTGHVGKFVKTGHVGKG